MGRADWIRTATQHSKLPRLFSSFFFAEPLWSLSDMYSVPEYIHRRWVPPSQTYQHHILIEFFFWNRKKYLSCIGPCVTNILLHGHHGRPNSLERKHRNRRVSSGRPSKHKMRQKSLLLPQQLIQSSNTIFISECRMRTLLSVGHNSTGRTS